MPYLRFLVCLLLVGCVRSNNPDLAAIVSPDGGLRLQPSMNESQSDPSTFQCVAFEVVDESGAVLHHVQTGASGKKEWAMGWFGETTIVLDSTERGIHAWQLDDDGSIRKLLPPLSLDIVFAAAGLREAKYSE